MGYPILLLHGEPPLPYSGCSMRKKGSSEPRTLSEVINEVERLADHRRKVVTGSLYDGELEHLDHGGTGV
jgi:hypothetical protein